MAARGVRIDVPFAAQSRPLLSVLRSPFTRADNYRDDNRKYDGVYLSSRFIDISDGTRALPTETGRNYIRIWPGQRIYFEY